MSKLKFTGIKLKLEKLFKEFWHSSIHNDSNTEYGNKLRHYRIYKTRFAKEEYLNLINHFPYRSTLAMFRLSSHKLHIESGRHVGFKDRLKPEDRLCSYCDLNVCENEFHFLIKCPNYSILRNELINLISNKFPNIHSFSEEELYFWLISNLDPLVISLLSKFLSKAFEKRTINQPYDASDNL